MQFHGNYSPPPPGRMALWRKYCHHSNTLSTDFDIFDHVSWCRIIWSQSMLMVISCLYLSLSLSVSYLMFKFSLRFELIEKCLNSRFHQPVWWLQPFQEWKIFFQCVIDLKEVNSAHHHHFSLSNVFLPLLKKSQNHPFPRYTLWYHCTKWSQIACESFLGWQVQWKCDWKCKVWCLHLGKTAISRSKQWKPTPSEWYILSVCWIHFHFFKLLKHKPPLSWIKTKKQTRAKKSNSFRIVIAIISIIIGLWWLIWSLRDLGSTLWQITIILLVNYKYTHILNTLNTLELYTTQ